MRKLFLTFLKISAVAITSMACSASSLFAQDRTIEVNLTSTSKPENAVGLILKNGTTLQKPVTKIEQSGESQYVLTFGYTPEELEAGSLASAMAINEERQVIFGDVKLITGSLSAKSFLSLPNCPELEPEIGGVKDQIGLLESLVEIRSARKEGHKLRLSQLMNGALLEKLKRLEKGFGLQYARPLSSDINSFDLVDRLSRLTNAIRNYQERKPAVQK